MDRNIKSLFYGTLGIVMLYLFTPTIEVFVLKSKYFYWLRNITSSWLFDVLILLSVILYSSLKINNCDREIPNNKINLIIGIGFLFYLYQRFYNHVFDFTLFNFNKFFNSSVAYLDVFVWIIILQLGGYLKYLVPSKNINFGNILLNDDPIQYRKEDELGDLYKVTANKIVKILKHNSFENSFSIGLNGEWGDGKTSVFNLLKEKIKNQDDLIIVDFNPWMGSDHKVLVKDFFSAISESVGGSLSNDFENYANELFSNGELSFLEKLFHVSLSNKTIKTQFDDLNERIGLLNKKLVIFIDDVDRLDKQELFEVLKLIRNTANFKNTFFIVAYDRAYVNYSIKDHSGFSVVKYLDKIINVELGLPYYDKDILKEYFIKQLKLKIPEKFHSKIDFYIDSYAKDPFMIDIGFESNDLFIGWLNNFREIKKLVNAIVINYSEVYNEINLVDAIYLEILKLKHPQIYLYLYTKHTDLFVVNHNIFCYELAPIDKVKAEQQRFKSFLEKQKEDNNAEIPTVLDYYLNGYFEENDINDIEKEKLKDLLSRLFNKTGGSLVSSVDNDERLSVRYVNMFERYFSNVVFKHHISEVELNDFFALEEEKIPNKIKYWYNEKKISDLTRRLNEKYKFTDVRQYENTLVGLFLLSKDKSNNVDFNKTIHKMFGTELIPNVYNNNENLSKFYIKLFESDYASDKFKANLLYELRKRNIRRPVDNPERFHLSNEEIETFLEKYILERVNDEINFNNGFWDLYFTCQKMNESGVKIPFVKVNDTLLAKINDDDDIKLKFLKSLIIYNGYGYTSNFRYGAIENLFESFEKFESEILDKLPDEEYFRAYKEYYYKSKDNRWTLDEFDYAFIKQSIPNDSPLVERGLIKIE